MLVKLTTGCYLSWMYRLGGVGSVVRSLYGARVAPLPLNQKLAVITADILGRFAIPIGRNYIQGITLFYIDLPSCDGGATKFCLGEVLMYEERPKKICLIFSFFHTYHNTH
jgi:hypothetical protein